MSSTSPGISFQPIWLGGLTGKLDWCRITHYASSFASIVGRQGHLETSVEPGRFQQLVFGTLVGEMAPSGVLRPVDAFALMQLCEDQAMLDTLRKGMDQMARELTKKAKENKRELPGGPLIQLSRTIEGRRTLSTIRELSAQIIVQRREFGLTPASNGRVQTAGAGLGFMDPLERALCGRCCRNVAELEVRLQDAWVHIAGDKLLNLVHSMPARIHSVIAAGGGNTRY